MLLNVQNSDNEKIVWESVIKTTGGAVATDKSWWYLITHVWENGQWSESDAGQRFDLIAHDKDGRAHSLKYLQSNVASEML